MACWQKVINREIKEDKQAYGPIEKKQLATCASVRGCRTNCLTLGLMARVEEGVAGLRRGETRPAEYLATFGGEGVSHLIYS